MPSSVLSHLNRCCDAFLVPLPLGGRVEFRSWFLCPRVERLAMCFCLGVFHNPSRQALDALVTSCAFLLLLLVH